MATPRLAGEPIPGEVVLRSAGGDLLVSDYQGVTVYTDAVRNGAGEVAWLRFSGRLYPAVR